MRYFIFFISPFIFTAWLLAMMFNKYPTSVAITFQSLHFAHGQRNKRLVNWKLRQRKLFTKLSTVSLERVKQKNSVMANETIKPAQINHLAAHLMIIEIYEYFLWLLDKYFVIYYFMCVCTLNLIFHMIESFSVSNPQHYKIRLSSRFASYVAHLF